MKKFLTLLLFLSTLFSYAQIGIGTDNPDPSAAVDIVSSNSGMLLPRLKMSERDNIANPAQGLMIYCTDCGSHGQLQLFNGSSWFGLSLTDASSDDMDNDGYTNDLDCDDTNPNINPGATETCNGIDDDCDGITDASFTASLSLLSSDTESVSTSSFTNYNDNLLRAYSNSGNKVNGFIKFNLSSLPDNAEINSVSLRLVLMTNYNSPYNSPNLDVYYVETDDWSRANTPANGISLTALLNTNNTSFDATNTYELDLTAWDISSDLTDNVLTLGLTNTKNDYSYVYFHGSDEGTRPVLIVSYTECD